MANKKSTSQNTQSRSAAGTSSMGGLAIWAPLIIIVFTGLLYNQSLNNGFLFIDDDYYVLKNQYLRDLSWNGIQAIFTHFYSFNYHPLTTISNLLEFSIWGLNPLPYHLFNLLLHLLNIWLVFRLAERLSGRFITAMVVSVLFAIHPMHVESVAWIAERKDVLYSAFYIGSLLAYLRYCDSGNKAHYVVSIILFLLSCLSKSAAVTLPVLLLAIDFYRSRKISGSVITEKLPYLALSVLFGVLAIMSQRAGGALNDMSFFYSFTDRIFILTTGLAAYFVKLVWPSGLAAIHYFPDLHGGSLPWYYFASVPFLIIIGWLSARRSARRREILFGLTFFLIAISVMLQFVTVGAAVYSERYTYISYIGLFYIAGQFIADAWETKAGNNVMIGFIAVVLLFSYSTFARIPVWHDSETMFTDIVEKEPDNWRNAFVYYYWGISRSSEGNTHGALECFDKAIKLKPDYDKAYNSRGFVHTSLQNYKDAIADFSKAITLKPDNANAFNGRGWASFEIHDTSAALTDISKSIQLDPKYAEAYNNRGWIYYMAGKYDSAIADYTRSIAADPGFTKPYFNRAAVKMSRSDFAGAISDYNQLISMNSNDALAYLSRGMARVAMKDKKACSDISTAADMGNADAAQYFNEHCR